jgi:tRNA threonylcarbamoyl adenosine modification protein (Sua5/YciO/YrdC/YwlC family)
MSERYDCRDAQARTAGIDAAVTAARAGELIVLPTDTVYGIGADAFTPAAVTTMLAAKGRGRNMPPPVLVGTARAAAALAEDLGAFGQDLIDEFWPGALTLVFRASPTLLWDLGDTKGTVALRMPLHSVALEVLKQTGPLAVSSANRHGHPSAITADEAQEQLGESVSVYLDGGPCAENIPSTILDLTGTIPKVLRAGAISVDRLRMVASVIADNEHYTESAGPTVDSPAVESPTVDSPTVDSRAAGFKPALPHPLEGSGGSAGPAVGEPPSGA